MARTDGQATCCFAPWLGSHILARPHRSDAETHTGSNPRNQPMSQQTTGLCPIAVSPSIINPRISLSSEIRISWVKHCMKPRHCRSDFLPAGSMFLESAKLRSVHLPPGYCARGEGGFLGTGRAPRAPASSGSSISVAADVRAVREPPLPIHPETLTPVRQPAPKRRLTKPNRTRGKA